MVKKDLLSIILLLIISFPAVNELFIPGAFTSHDLTHHVVRQISMDKLLSEGQFPPRWSGELNNDFGYPLFLFNYPLPPLLGEVFHLLGLGFVDSVKAVLLTSMLISVVGTYLFLNSLLSNRVAAFLGAMFYLYAPYRLLNIYVSASVGTSLALGILPFVFWNMVVVVKGKRWGILAGSLSLAFLILSHNVTTLIFAPVILVFAGILIQEFKQVKNLGIMFLLGLGLSCWFWLPAIVEKQYIIFDAVFGQFYKDQFVTLWQLFRSPWGYGLSHPQNPEPGDMSYQLGLVHIGVVCILLFLFFLSSLRKKGTINNYLYRLLIAFVLLTFFLSVFLMLKISLPLWENLPFLSLIQFPLRFSAAAVFTSSIAAALLIVTMRSNIPRWVLFFSLLFLVIYANRNHWHINQVFNPGEEYYLNHKTTTASYNEHLPKWGRAMEKRTTPKIEFTEGNGKIEITKDYSGLVLAEVESTTAGKLRLNQFYFPGWEIKVNDQRQDFNYLIDGQNYGLMLFDIETGRHNIRAQFKNTSIRNLADVISFISVIIIIIELCRLSPRILFRIKKSS